MSCTTKHIDEFCNNFLSLNMNLGGASGPTLECQILGEPDYTKSHELIVEGVKQKLTEANIPIVGEWTLLSVSTDKSSGGIITTVRMIDSVWAKANSMHIGVTGESGGDIMLGNEYFHIAGVPVGGYGVPGEAILRRSFLLDNYDKLNKGTHYITTSGNIVSKPTNLTSQEFLSTYMPGIPHPNVEFGSFYYTPAELFSTVSNNLGIQTPQNSSTTSSDDLPAINFYGLYNTSGTVFDVMSQIGNTFGFLYVHNSFWGSRYLNLDGNIGKIDVLTEAGISAPNSSVSSSFEVDYSSGLTWNATKITKMPGRYKRDVPDSRDPTDGQMFFSVEQRVGSYNGGIIDSGDIYGEFTEHDFVWAMMKDTQLVHDIGISAVIEDAGELALNQEFFKSTYSGQGWGESHEWYTGFAETLNGADILQYAAVELGYEDEHEKIGSGAIDYTEDCIGYFKDFNRFQYCAKHGTEYDLQAKPPFASGFLVAYGTQESDRHGNSAGDTCAFHNFGSKFFNLGSKQWSSEAGAKFDFILGSASIAASPLAPAKREGIVSIADFFAETSFENLTQYDEQGIILFDFGENPMPSINTQFDLEGYEPIVDISPSIKRGSNEAAYGGVGAIALKQLKDIFSEHAYEIKEAIVDAKNSNPTSEADIGFSGIKKRDTSGMGNRSGSGRYGTSLQERTDLDADQQRETINNEPFANRKLYPHSCNPELSPEMEEKVGSDAYLLNKTQYNHVVDYAWTSGGTPQGNRSNAVSYITESGKVEQFAYNDLCANGYIVPYLEKIKFSLINELYTGFSFKYLESLNINVVDGKMIANYAFSQKNMMPDFKGLAGARVKLQNMI